PDDLIDEAVNLAVRALLFQTAGRRPIVAQLILKERTFLQAKVQVRPHVSPEQPGKPESGFALRDVHHRILKVCGSVPLTAKAIARRAGSSRCTSNVHAGLSELVRAGLLLHGPEGYWIAETSERHSPGPDQEPLPTSAEPPPGNPCHPGPPQDDACMGH